MKPGRSIHKVTYSIMGSVIIFSIMVATTIATAQTVGLNTDITDTTNTLASSTASDASNLNIDVASTTPIDIENATTTPVASPIPLTCTTAYIATLYNTPSGHLDQGYSVSTSDATSTLTATEIGNQAWVDCHDNSGKVYEFKLTDDQYAALAAPGAVMPEEELSATSSSVIATSTSDTKNIVPTIGISTSTPTEDLTASTTPASDPNGPANRTTSTQVVLPSTEISTTTTPIDETSPDTSSTTDSGE